MQNGIDLMIDTNILIYWLNGDENAASILEENNIYYSIITEIEVKGHISLLNKAEQKKLDSILQKFKRIDITEQVKDIAIQYRVDYKLKTPDAIIAASSHILKIPLFTADKKLSMITDIVIVLFEPKSL